MLKKKDSSTTRYVSRGAGANESSSKPACVGLVHRILCVDCVAPHGLALMSGDIWRNDVTKAVARVATHDPSLFPSQRSFPGRGDVYVCDRKQHKKSDFEFLRKSTLDQIQLALVQAIP
jgi:hypothetical protein